MDKEIVLAFLGALTAVFTAVGALIKFWENSKNKTVDYEKKARLDVLKKADQTVEVLELQVGMIMNKVSELQTQLEFTRSDVKEYRKESAKLIELLKDYITASGKRIWHLENTLQAASIRKVGDDTYIITPKKKN